MSQHHFVRFLCFVTITISVIKAFCIAYKAQSEMLLRLDHFIGYIDDCGESDLKLNFISEKT